MKLCFDALPIAEGDTASQGWLSAWPIRQPACADEGKAVITPGFELSPFIIHTPGPIWQDGFHAEEITLRSCYRSCLDLAIENDCHSVAFPLISSGIFGYPFDEALRVAREEILGFLEKHEITVYLVLLRRPARYPFREKSELERYLCKLDREAQEILLESQRDEYRNESARSFKKASEKLRIRDLNVDIRRRLRRMTKRLMNVKSMFAFTKKCHQICLMPCMMINVKEANAMNI